MPTECCYSPQITHILTYICYINLLGTGQATKTDELSQKFRIPFDPPTHTSPLPTPSPMPFFGETSKKTYIKVQNLEHKYLDWKWPPPRPLEVVQKFIHFAFGSLTCPLNCFHR